MSGKKMTPSRRADFLSEEEFFSTAYLAGAGVIRDETLAAYPEKLVESQLLAQQDLDERAAQVEDSGRRRDEWRRAKQTASNEAE